VLDEPAAGAPDSVNSWRLATAAVLTESRGDLLQLMTLPGDVVGHHRSWRFDAFASQRDRHANFQPRTHTTLQSLARAPRTLQSDSAR